LPNVRDSLAVQGAMQWSWIFLAVSSLSYLGMGVAPPTPDWGQMIADGRGLMQQAPWTVIWPMAALSSLSFHCRSALCTFLLDQKNQHNPILASQLLRPSAARSAI